MDKDLSLFLALHQREDAPGAANILAQSAPAIQPVRRPPANGHARPVAEIHLATSSGAAASPVPAPASSAPIADGRADPLLDSSHFPPAPIARPRRRTVEVAMPSLGIIDRLMGDDDVHDILISGLQPIYVDVAGQMIDSGLRFESHDQVWQLAERIMDTIGQRWSPERPLLDTRLPDGSRVNIVAPPMAVDGVSISIRKFPAIRITLETMVERNQLTPELAEFLSQIVRSRLNLIVAGGTSSGKTTLLNALSSVVEPSERIVTIEDSAELRLQQPHVVRLESKSPAPGEAPEAAVTIRDLVKNALRMRPDRIIVGESRGAEAFDVLQAMNTGHDGSMTTLHANSPRDAIMRLESMVSLAMPQLTARGVRQQIASTVHLLVQMTRTKDGKRRLSHITEIAGLEGETLTMQDLIIWQGGGNGHPPEYRWVGNAPRHPDVTEAARATGMLRGMR